MRDLLLLISVVLLPVLVGLAALWVRRRDPLSKAWDVTYVLAVLLSIIPFAVLVASVGWTRHSERTQSPGWPQVSGVVLSSSLGLTRHAYTPDIKFLYEFQGVRRTGDFLFLDRPSMSQAHAMAYVNALVPGSAVLVHVKPSDPDRAVVIPESRDSGIFLLVLGVAMVLVKLGGALYLWRSGRAQRGSSRLRSQHDAH